MYIFLWRNTLHIFLIIFVSGEMILAEDSECCWCLRMPEEESFLPSRLWTVILDVCSIGDRLQDPKPGRLQYWMRDDILMAVNIQMSNWMWHCIVRWLFADLLQEPAMSLFRTGCVLNINLCLSISIFVNNQLDAQFFSMYVYFYSLHVSAGDRSSTVVKVLCYKSEGRWFHSSWCQLNFS